ncbi:MAG: hypothetical protein K6A40_00080 [Solobacterium sp.]|nr:hypothetical protein [Solobacterium sp.]
MKLYRAPFRAYVEEVTGIEIHDHRILDADGKSYDADLYYVYSVIDVKSGIFFRILAAVKLKPFRILSENFNVNIPWSVVKDENLIPHPVREEKMWNRYQDVICELDRRYACSDEVRETRFWGSLDLARKPDHPDIVTLCDKNGRSYCLQIIGLDGTVIRGYCFKTKTEMKIRAEGDKWYVSEE